MLAQHKASLLGMELTTLSNDDGKRLSTLLWQLRHEVKNDPTDLWATTALSTAQALAGLTTEARRMAIRSLELLESVPGVPADLQLNVAVRLLRRASRRPRDAARSGDPDGSRTEDPARGPDPLIAVTELWDEANAAAEELLRGLSRGCSGRRSRPHARRQQSRAASTGHEALA